MRAHWRHLVNTIKLVLPSAHQGPQPKRQIDRFSCCFTAHGRKSLYFTMGAPFLHNCPSQGWSGPLFNMIPWVHPSPQPKRHLDRFCRFFCTDDCRVFLNFTMRCPIPPFKSALSHGRSGPPSKTWFPGPTRVLNPNGILIGWAVFAGLTSVTDRHNRLLGR